LKALSVARLLLLLLDLISARRAFMKVLSVARVSLRRGDVDEDDDAVVVAAAALGFGDAVVLLRAARASSLLQKMAWRSVRISAAVVRRMGSSGRSPWVME